MRRGGKGEASGAERTETSSADRAENARKDGRVGMGGWGTERRTYRIRGRRGELRSCCSESSAGRSRSRDSSTLASRTGSQTSATTCSTQSAPVLKSSEGGKSSRDALRFPALDRNKRHWLSELPDALDGLDDGRRRLVPAEGQRPSGKPRKQPESHRRSVQEPTSVTVFQPEPSGDNGPRRAPPESFFSLRTPEFGLPGFIGL